MATDQKLEERYDRQVRLWGVEGQKRLSKATICLIGCGGAGVEGLKNLVLPGVGTVVIVDGKKVEPSHLGISFFLEHSSVGKSLASETLKYILQLNPYVKGAAVEKDPQQVINEEFLSQYTLYISNQLSQKQNIELSKICQKLNKPLIIVNSYGFYAYIRNQMICHQIHEVKQNKKYDLRVRQPFQGLIDHVNLFDIDQLIKGQGDDKILEVLIHIPYGILLVKAFQLSPNKTREQIKQIILKWKKQINHESIANFDQALNNLMAVNLKKENVFDDLAIILNHEKSLNATEQSGLFWKFSRTLKSYIEKYNNYPQSFDLPDMHASTDAYINLKNVYKAENLRTKSLFKEIFAQLFPQSQYTDIEIDTFVENVLSLSIVQMRPYYQQIQAPNFTFDGDWPQIYIALRAADAFKEKYQRLPVSTDFNQVKQLISKIIQSYPDQNIMISPNQIIQQVCRSQQSEMISISSIAGSIVAQQAIKLITHLFTPMNSGYFFDGVKTEGYMTEL